MSNDTATPARNAHNAIDLACICDEVTFHDWKIDIAVDDCGFRVRWVFWEKDNMNPDDEQLHAQTGRWWFVEQGARRSSVLKTLYLAAQQAMLHEFQEQFKVGGKPLLDPHAEIA